MSIELVKIKGSNNWYLRGTLHGVSVFRSTKTADRRVAEAIRVRHEQDIQTAAAFGIEAAGTFSQAVVKYLTAGGSPRYLDRINFAIGRRRLAEITQDDLDALARLLYPDAKPQTLNRHVYTPFIAVYSYAAGARLCPERKWRRPKMKKSQKGKAPAPEQLYRFYQHADDRMKFHILFLTYSGLRISEAVRLQAKDIDLDNAWGVVQRAKGDNAERAGRGFPLHRILVRELRRRNLQPNDYLFQTHRGLPYAQREKVVGGHLKVAWNPLRTASGVNITPHDLRHTCVSWLMEAGVGKEARMDIVGHTRATVHDTYAHMPRKALIEAINKLKDFRPAAQTISRIFHDRSRIVLTLSHLLQPFNIEKKNAED